MRREARVEVEMSKIDTQLKFLRNSLANLVMDYSVLKSIQMLMKKILISGWQIRMYWKRLIIRLQNWILDLLCLYTILKMECFIIIKKIVWFQNLCSSRLLIRQNYLIIDNGVQYGVN